MTQAHILVPCTPIPKLILLYI